MNSGSWWWTGRPGVLQFMGSQRVRHDWETELNWTDRAEYNQSDFGADHLVMSMCRVFSCVVGRGCLLWSVHFLGRTLLVFALLHFVLQTCLLLQVSLDFLLLHSHALWWKGHLSWVLVLKGLVGLHRTVQLQLLQLYWLRHRLGLLIISNA